MAVFLCAIALGSCYFFAWYCDFCGLFGGRKVKIEESIDFLEDFESYRFYMVLKVIRIKGIGRTFEGRNYFVSFSFNMK